MTNKKNKNKNKIGENITFSYDSHSFHINNSEYFLAISDLNIANGIDIVKNILIFSKKIEKNNSLKTAISTLEKDKKIQGTYIAQNWENINYFIEYTDKITIITFIDTNLNPVNISNSLQANSSEKGFYNGKLDLGQIIIINDILNLKELIKYYKIAIETKMKYFEGLKLPKHIQKIVNNDEFLVVTSIVPSKLIKEDNNNLPYIFNQYLEENTLKEKNHINKDNLKNLASEEKNSQDTDENNNVEDIEKELIETIIKTCDNCLKKSNISFGILDYIIAENISIDALVDAGMELCVGVEDSRELREKLKKQLLKSLEDLNVIALLMSAIRCEDDFQNNRLREVDVSDDPAYLYTDEVLGIAIANQIAGTKATFNFKRYDEEKPGIIAKLGPMVDDIFAGLVAGCMSKIFEDDY